MNSIPAFSGLDSHSLFSRQTLDIAAQDAMLADSGILLRSCHRIFLTEVARAIDSNILDSGIALEDFTEPQSLIQPPEHYHGNIVMQHTTLYLVQLLRYIRHMSRPYNLLGVAGFGAGLLPAVAVASSPDLPELLSQSQKFFYVALWIGIRADDLTRREAARSPHPLDLPWNLVVDGLSPQRAKEVLLFEEAETDTSHVYLSAISADDCCTLSGRGSELQRFVREKLPIQCMITETNVQPLYHSQAQFAELRYKLVEDLRGSIATFPDTFVVCAPVFSTINGKAVRFPTPSSLEQVCNMLFDLIPLEPVNWRSLQFRLLSTIEQMTAEKKISCEILNFGPGYGMSRSQHMLASNVRIVDV